MDPHTMMEEFGLEASDDKQLPDIAAKLRDLKLRESDAKAVYESLKLHRTATEQELIAHMENLGIESFKTGDGTFYTRADWYAGIDSEQKWTVFEWLRRHDLGGMVQENINPKTLSAWAKERMEAGEEIPDGIKVTVIKRVGMLKAKNN